MNTFQIIFTPTSAAELARMPKELQLSILGDFRGLPQHVIASELEDFGKLESNGHILHRFRIGDYRVYFERHRLGVLVHRIMSRHTLKDFFYRSRASRPPKTRRPRKIPSSGNSSRQQKTRTRIDLSWC